MRIHLMTMWYNEEFLAPFFLNHYSWVDKIHILLDADTNDNTESIARSYSNVSIEYFSFPDKMDDIIKVKKFNSKYLEITEADYVIIVDSDEFIFCNDLKKQVKDHISETDKDLYFVSYWQIYEHENDLPLHPTIPVPYLRRHGDPSIDIGYIKPAIVKTGKNLLWGYGHHEILYEGYNVKWESKSTAAFDQRNIAHNPSELLNGAHWRLVDLEQTIHRRITNRKERQSDYNRTEGYCSQYHAISETDIINEYNRHKKSPTVIRHYPDNTNKDIDCCDNNSISPNHLPCWISLVAPDSKNYSPELAVPIYEMAFEFIKMGDRRRAAKLLVKAVYLDPKSERLQGLYELLEEDKADSALHHLKL